MRLAPTSNSIDQDYVEDGGGDGDDDDGGGDVDDDDFDEE